MSAGSVLESEVHRKGRGSTVDVFILFADTVRVFQEPRFNLENRFKVNGVIAGTYQQHWGKIRTHP